MLDIILDRDDTDITLVADHIRNPVNIGGIVADNPHARDVITVFHHVLKRRFVPVTLQLLYNALRRLDPRLDVLDRIILVHQLELPVQDIQLRGDLFQGRLIDEHDLLIGIDPIVVHFQFHMTPYPLALRQQMLPPAEPPGKVTLF